LSNVEKEDVSSALRAMLRDIPPFGREADANVFMTAAPGIESEHTNQADSLDDVFGSAPASPTSDNGGATQRDQRSASRASALDPSDIPRLRSTHVTNGYREGIAVSKERHMQEGFDEGYTLGAEVGLGAGWYLGALEGIWHALHAGKTTFSAEASDSVLAQRRDEMRQMLATAEVELSVQSLFGQDFFGSDGIWLYEVPVPEDGVGEATFQQIAEAHPVLKKWHREVARISGDSGLDLLKGGE